MDGRELIGDGESAPRHPRHLVVVDVSLVLPAIQDASELNYDVLAFSESSVEAKPMFK